MKTTKSQIAFANGILRAAELLMEESSVNFDEVLTSQAKFHLNMAKIAIRETLAVMENEWLQAEDVMTSVEENASERHTSSA